MNCENFVYFAKAFRAYQYSAKYHPEIVEDFYGVEGLDKETAQNQFMNHISSAIINAKVFEVDDNVKKLLALTNTPMNDGEVKLPFPSMFLDVSFTAEEFESYGLKDFKTKELIGILVTEGHLISSGSKSETGINLRITILSRINTEKDADVWFDTFNKNIVITDEKFKNVKVSVAENPTTCKVTRDFIHKFFLNFLHFLNNPEVEYIEHKRSEKNFKRKAESGKVFIPSSFNIKITGKLYHYIDELNEADAWNYHYRFWVRGHFRKLKSEKYAVKKTIWIAPFIKGKGILVDKFYKIGEEK